MAAPRYVVNVETAVLRDGKYLLVERSPQEDHAAGTLAFPGGKVEQSPGATAPIEATAERELAEEVGVDIEDVTYVRSRTFETDTGEQVLNVVTRAAYAGGEATPRDPDEVAAVHWLSPGAIQSRGDVPAYLKRDVAELEQHGGKTS